MKRSELGQILYPFKFILTRELDVKCENSLMSQFLLIPDLPTTYLLPPLCSDHPWTLPTLVLVYPASVHFWAVPTSGNCSPLSQSTQPLPTPALCPPLASENLWTLITSWHRPSPAWILVNIFELNQPLIHEISLTCCKYSSLFSHTDSTGCCRFGIYLRTVDPAVDIFSKLQWFSYVRCLPNPALFKIQTQTLAISLRLKD